MGHRWTGRKWRTQVSFAMAALVDTEKHTYRFIIKIFNYRLKFGELERE
jgi:hypothetical protein